MKVIAENKRARFEYEILEKFEAGIVLSGHEAKSAKMGHPNLTGSYGVVRGGEAYVLELDMPSFQPLNVPGDYDSKRTKKLLLTKKEINRLAGKLQEGLTLVPIKMYSKNGLVKVELGLGKGRKKKDKRDYLKKRDTEKEIRKAIDR